ncbi:DUF47 domain-containing protein [Ruania halotolerans]|uniref:DUF47 domain-containing protein n=1 Tax=Ruania halotolerans TaxID=2897773 RepID=UPI001E29397C|nr:DUF47 family protein [Ruania halotolerans]UFU08450.1 DUF47 family protein [Ruania halotolerans]
MRLRLTPRDAVFFDLLAASAAQLVVGADLLAQLIAAEPPDRVRFAERLREAEHEADVSTHEIMRRLNQTFVTPFDRDDIYRLASGLDDCMDAMEAAGDLMVLYQVDALPGEVATQVATLQRSAELTAGVMPKLRSMREDVRAYWIEINRLENEADRAYRGLLALLFQSPKYQESPAAVIEMIKLKGVIDTLEQAADSFESVAHQVEALFLKES